MKDKNNHLRDAKHLFLLGVKTIVSWGCGLKIHIGKQRQIAQVNSIVLKADKIFNVKVVYDPRNSTTAFNILVKFVIFFFLYPIEIITVVALKSSRVLDHIPFVIRTSVGQM